MITVGSPLADQLSATTTKPGYLIRLGYSSTIYISTLGDVSWAGVTWTGIDCRVTGLRQDGSASNSASLSLGNTDLTYSALVLNEGACDIPVSIWAVYGNNEAAEVVTRFVGVTDGATSISEREVVLQLVRSRNKVLYSPRVFINRPTFNFLQPAGTRIVVGTETFELTR